MKKTATTLFSTLHGVLLVMCVFVFAVVFYMSIAGLAMDSMDPGTTIHWSSGRTTDNQTLPGIIEFFFAIYLFVVACRMLTYMNVAYYATVPARGNGYVVVGELVVGILIAWNIPTLLPAQAGAELSGSVKELPHALLMQVFWTIFAVFLLATILSLILAGKEKIIRFARGWKESFTKHGKDICPMPAGIAFLIGVPSGGIIFGGISWFMMQNVPGSFLFGFLVGASWPGFFIPSAEEKN